jgi:hypothetical protein
MKLEMEQKEQALGKESEEFDILDYVQANIIGLCMLMFAFIIIYLVDRVANYNANIFSPLPMIPTVPGIAMVPAIFKKPKRKHHVKT